MTNGDNEIIIANRNGRAIRLPRKVLYALWGRTATGVRGMTLDEDGQDEVVGNEFASKILKQKPLW